MSVEQKQKDFQRAVDAHEFWRKQARKCYDYRIGRQWNKDAQDVMEKQGRPALTINRVRPFMNLLTGFYTYNKTEPDFLPRTIGDDDVCRIAKAVTKWVYDKAKYEKNKVQVFSDKVTGGKGVYYVATKVNYDSLEEDIVIDRISPFSVYLDPECLNPDLSDARYVCVAKWVDKEELMRVYPEFKDEIDVIVASYMDEKDVERRDVWYHSENKKLRLVEHYEREYSMQTVYDLQGTLVREEDLPAALMQYYQQTGMVMTPQELRKERLPKCKIKQTVFVSSLELESGDYRYTHGKFPIVMDYAYYTGEPDSKDWSEPHGVCFDLIDLQDEKNKIRSQVVHLINTTSNKGLKHWGLSEEDKRKLKNFGSTPGVTIEVPPEGLLEPFQNPGFPTELFQIEQQTEADMRGVTGINEEMLGMDVPANSSGRAIELRQRQAVTQIAVLFEGSKQAEHRVLDILWGDKWNPGLIPQFMNEGKMIRIVDDNGNTGFVQLSQTGEKAMLDANGMPIFDLSKFEFDVVMGDSPSSPTQRAADFMKILEAQKFGVPIPPELFVEYLDIPNKQMVKQRMMEMQQQAAMAQQQNGRQNQGMQTADLTAGVPQV
jgi:hypothetical protein